MRRAEPTPDQINETVKEMTAAAMDESRIIEAGWQGFKLAVMPPGCPVEQVHAMRISFFAGAQHLFNSIISVLEPGQEATDKDMQRVANVHKELVDYQASFHPKVHKPEIIT